MYLVIGATEMTGAHLICTMLRQGFAVRATRTLGEDTEYTKNILRLYTDDAEILYNEIDWVYVDYNDPDTLETALDGICSTICCITPKLGKNISIDDNVNIIHNIINAVKDSECEYFCYLSSVRALGDESDTTEITEKSQRNPKGKYSKSSQAYYLCEMEVWRAMQEGLNAGIINTAAILGPGDWHNDRSKFLNDKMSKVYYTEGVTGLVSVNDLVKCIMTMVRKKISNESFIVCADNISYRDLQSYFQKHLGQKVSTRKAGWLRLCLWKIQYAIKSLISGRRPFIDSDFFDELTQFSIYSNRKSLRKLIIQYEEVENSVKNICKYYKKSKEITK